MSSGNWKELFDAACAGDMNLVRYHLRHGVNVNHIHPEYSGTILVACILTKQESAALELLSHGADPNLYSSLDGMSPLEAAISVGLTAVEQRLRDLGAQAPVRLPPRTLSAKLQHFFGARRLAKP